jgi:hypothetical protein
MVPRYLYVSAAWFCALLVWIAGRGLVASVKNPAHRAASRLGGAVAAALVVTLVVTSPLFRSGPIDEWWLLGEWQRKGYVSENYSSIMGTGDDHRLSSDRFHSWGALLAIMAFVESGAMPAPEAPLPSAPPREASCCSPEPWPSTMPVKASASTASVPET